MKGLSLIIDNNETNNNIPCFLLKRNEKGGKVGSSSSKESESSSCKIEELHDTDEATTIPTVKPVSSKKSK